MDAVQPSDDQRRPGAASDAWDLWFWSPLAEVGGYVRLELRPTGSWYWAALCGPERQLVTVVEPDAPSPRPPGLELRASGLWADVVIETPMDHTSVGLEAFGVGLDDPLDAYGKAWGDQVPLGFDLEWETTMPPSALPGRRHLPCLVHGEILVGHEALDLTGWGHRIRSWGADDWWTAPSWTCAGRLDDGSQLWATGDDLAGAGVGGSTRPGAPQVVGQAVLAVDGDDGTGLTGGRLRLDDDYVALSPLAMAPVAVTDGRRRGHVVRSLVRFDRADGRSGSGWLELIRPQ